MVLIRPRVTDFHGIMRPQSELDFAIPFYDEDIPLYVDPFLLWKSPSMQDQSLHTAATNSFNHLNSLVQRGKDQEARAILIRASECDEVGLGLSGTRTGKRIGESKANAILDLFRQIEHYRKYGFTHFEEIQLYIEGLSRDRVSDICCSFLKSWLIDYTMQECEDLGIPTSDTIIPEVYDYRGNVFRQEVPVKLPTAPETNAPILFVPKRWLRFVPWINFDDYFRAHCPKDQIFAEGEKEDPVKVLRFNRQNYGAVRSYVESKERTQSDCQTDPLFEQIPVTSAKRTWGAIRKLPTGKDGGADKKYEDGAVKLLASLLYPHLDFAADQSRTVSGTLIRDLIFYNNRQVDFLNEIHRDFGSRQLVFEMKNVAKIGGGHINQLNRYLEGAFGGFGVLVTRKPLSKAMFKNTVDLWSGKRRCVIALTDADMEFMVTLFESRQREPLDVLKKKYVEFRRACPS